MADISEIKKQQLIKIRQLQELGMKLSPAQEALLASASEDEEKPEAGKKKKKTQSLLTRLLSLLTRNARPDPTGPLK